ncbi:potassium channel subfamily K member 16-like isoform X3 [Mastomys coucha]|uniref:potassium channel subfamily K member 16-like isoform X3 n=1 Tax=Mastomys coucha TaxID=35658 RepID=UPI0012615890|nr:potassium channel subfamily K member 16-like isoform X3 [Mastomys coucha]
MPRAGVRSCWGGQILPLLLAYICYLLLGATVFQLLEKQAEAQSRDQFQLEKLRFLENYTCLDQQALEQFVQVILEAWVKGVNPKGNSTNPSNWDFGSSFFFAGTVVTTIVKSKSNSVHLPWQARQSDRGGYGNLAPSTEAGQIFCVFYALMGIPLNVVFLNHLGTGLRAHLTTLDRWEDHPRHSQPRGGLELPGRLLLRLHHPQHYWLRGLCCRHRPQQALHRCVSELGSYMDPTRTGVAGGGPQPGIPASAQVLPALAAHQRPGP